MAELYPTVYMRDQFVPSEQATVSIASAPFLYGLSVYTVMPVFWNDEEQQLYLFRLEDHFKRLQNSAKILAFDDFLRKWNYAAFANTIRELLSKNEVRQDALVRITVFVDALLSGTRMHSLPHELAAFVYQTSPLLPEHGAHLGVSSWRRTPDNAIPSRAKVNGSYVNAALMKNEAVLSGYDDAIALDEQGHVTESTVANIFLVKDGKLITPSASTDLLEGITRDTILRLSDSLGIASEQRSVDRSELYLADEVFLSGSSVRLTPVTMIDYRQIGSGRPGPITGQLQEAYTAAARGNTADFAEWCQALAPVALPEPVPEPVVHHLKKHARSYHQVKSHHIERNAL